MTRQEINAKWSALREEFAALETEPTDDIHKAWIRNGKLRFVLKEMYNLLKINPQEIQDPIVAQGGE